MVHWYIQWYFPTSVSWAFFVWSSSSISCFFHLTHWHPRPWAQTTPWNPDKMATWVNSHTSVIIFQDFNAFPLSFCCKNPQKYYLDNKDLLIQLLSYICTRCFIRKIYENWQMHSTWHPLQSYVQCPSAFREI